MLKSWALWKLDIATGSDILARWKLGRREGAHAPHSTAVHHCHVPFRRWTAGRYDEIDVRLIIIVRKPKLSAFAFDFHDDGRVTAASRPLSPPPLHVPYNPSEIIAPDAFSQPKSLGLDNVNCTLPLRLAIWFERNSLRASDSVGASEPQVQSLTKPLE